MRGKIQVNWKCYSVNVWSPEQFMIILITIFQNRPLCNKNYAIIFGKTSPRAVYKNVSDVFIWFITHLCCIYKWQAIGRLRGGVETYVRIYLFTFLLLLKLKKHQDLSLAALFLFCCRKLQSSWIWFDKLCSKQTGSCWYSSKNNWLQIWERM